MNVSGYNMKLQSSEGKLYLFILQILTSVPDKLPILSFPQHTQKVIKESGKLNHYKTCILYKKNKK